MISTRPFRRLALGAFALAISWPAACTEDGRVPSEPPGAEAAKGGNGGGGGGSGSEPTVDDTEPGSAPQDTTLDIRVFGAGFDQGSTADLLLDGSPTPRVRTNSTRFVSENEVVANVTIAPDATVDLYDVRVTTSRGKKGIGIELFAITVKNNPSDPGNPLVIVLSSGVFTGDASGAVYDETIESDVDSHLSGSLGNLLFSVNDPDGRNVTFTVPNHPEASGLRYGRIFTNTTTRAEGEPVGWGELYLIQESDTDARAVLEAELRDGTNLYVLKFGEDCDGVIRDRGVTVDVTAASGKRTWTLSAADAPAYYCTKPMKGKPFWAATDLVTASFSMTLQEK